MPAKNTAKKTPKPKRAAMPKAKHTNTMSALDAAAKVLAETNSSMTAKEMIEAMKKSIKFCAHCDDAGLCESPPYEHEHGSCCLCGHSRRLVERLEA